MDLTIQQRWPPGKRCYRLSRFAMLLKRKEFCLALKRGDRAGFQTEMVEFIALPIRSPPQVNLKSGHFTSLQRSISEVSVECRSPIDRHVGLQSDNHYRPTYRSRLDRHIGLHVDRVWVDVSTDMSICPPRGEQITQDRISLLHEIIINEYFQWTGKP